MTREELIKGLNDCATILHGEAEGHMEADRLLLEYINDPEVTKAFADIPRKWYD